MRLPHSASRLRWRLPIARNEMPPVSGVHPVVRRILAARGLTEPEQVRAFLTHSAGDDSPFKLAGMPDAVSRVRQAVRDSEKIAVYGDFDCDGVTATALLTQAIRSIGGVVLPFLPHRERDGYGLHASALERLAREGVGLVITVDCGIRAVAAVDSAAALGLDVIVTDHHLLPAELPRAFAVINPHRPDCAYAYDGLAGVGLAFKLAQALLRVEERVPAAGRRTFRPIPEDALLDLVALGTVADVAPLTGENRSLVKRGLDAFRASHRLGLQVLLEVAEIPAARITAGTLAWSVGPRLNAAGRMDDADAALELLLTDEPRRARELAHELESRNERRRELTELAVETAKESVAEPAPYLIFNVSDDVALGVLGLVAGRLAERFYRPVAMVRIDGDTARGSLRSIPEFHVAKALEQVEDLLDSHGGHAMAAGFSARADRLDEIGRRLEAVAADSLAGLDLRRELRVDAVITPEDLDWALEASLAELEPFGEANPRALLCLSKASVANPQVVGADHLKFQIVGAEGRSPIRAIAFGQADRAGEIAGLVDLVGILRAGEWSGNRYLEYKVSDFQVADPDSPTL